MAFSRVDMLSALHGLVTGSGQRELLEGEDYLSSVFFYVKGIIYNTTGLSEQP